MKSSDTQLLSAQFTQSEALLIRKVAKARGEELSSFIRRACIKEIASPGYLSQEEKQAFGAESRKEIVSLVLAILGLAVASILLSEGVIALADISSAIAYFLVAGIVGIIFWGFKARITQKLEAEKGRRQATNGRHQ